MGELLLPDAIASTAISEVRFAFDKAKQRLSTSRRQPAIAATQWFRQPRFVVSLVVGIAAAYLCAVIPAPLGAWGRLGLAVGWSVAAISATIAAFLFHRACRLWRRRRGNPADGLQRLGRLQKVCFAIMGAVWALMLLTLALALLMFAGPVKMVLAFVALAAGIATYSLSGIVAGPPASVALLEWMTKPRWPGGPWSDQAEQALVAGARHAVAIASEKAQVGRGPTQLGRLVGAASRQAKASSTGGAAAWPADLSVSPRWIWDDIRWRAAGSLRLVCGMLPVVVLLLLIGLPGAEWLVRFAPLPESADAAAEETAPPSVEPDKQPDTPSAGRNESAMASDGNGQDGAGKDKRENQGSAGAQGVGQERNSQASGVGNSQAGGAQAQNGADQSESGNGGTVSNAGSRNGDGGAQAQGAGQQGAGSQPGGAQGSQEQGNSPSRGGSQGQSRTQNGAQGGAQTNANRAGSGRQPGTADTSPGNGASGSGKDGPQTDGAQPSKGQSNSGQGKAGQQDQGKTGKGAGPSAVGEPSTTQPAADKAAFRGGAKPGNVAGVDPKGSAAGTEQDGLSGNPAGGLGSVPGTGGQSAQSKAPVAPREIAPDAAGSMTVRLLGMGRERGVDDEPMPPLKRLDSLAVVPPGASMVPTVTINLPTLRGGASAAQRSDEPAPVAPALPRHIEPTRLPSQQPLPAWVGHILEGAR